MKMSKKISEAQNEIDELKMANVIGFRTFFGIFLRIIYVVRKVLLTLIVFIFIMGVLLSIVEGLSLMDGIYFAFVSALTVGYGDIVPHTIIGRTIAVFLLPITGMLITGIMVAAAINAIDKGLKKEASMRGKEEISLKAQSINEE